MTSIPVGILEIEVTKQHIKRGRRGRADRCPVFLAYKSVMPQLRLTVEHFPNPYLRAWIWRFDNKLPVLPFRLSVPFHTPAIDDGIKGGVYIQERPVLRKTR